MTDHEIINAINAGIDDVNALMIELEVATQCGSCLNEVVGLLESCQQHSQNMGLSTPAVYGIKKSANTLCLAD